MHITPVLQHTTPTTYHSISISQYHSYHITSLSTSHSSYHLKIMHVTSTSHPYRYHFYIRLQHTISRPHEAHHTQITDTTPTYLTHIMLRHIHIIPTSYRAMHISTSCTLQPCNSITPILKYIIPIALSYNTKFISHHVTSYRICITPHIIYTTSLVPHNNIAQYITVHFFLEGGGGVIFI